MALQFIDGGDHYVTADITKKWSANTGATIAATGRRGGGAIRFLTAGTSNYLTKTLGAQASWVVGFAFEFSAAGALVVARFTDAGTAQCELRQNLDGTLSVTRNGTALTNGTSVLALSTSTFYYIEWKVTIADSIAANSCKVRVNGADVITVATGQDLKNTANASANAFAIGRVAVTASGSSTFDDIYICDGTGSTNNDFLGDVRIDTLYPNADGAFSQFTPSTGTSHFALVDEATPNTTDHNDGATIGHRDSYAFGNLDALTSQTVYGVQVNAAIMKDDAGAKSASTFARSGSTNTDGASAALGTAQVYVSQVYEFDPNTAAAWTEATVNAAEFGVRVTA
ncbi:hypothetical protein [Methylibium sp.]|uniref:hypothetical protein n=1 Tax=Methylibium sp. TaxID=2067992 RepID=UPI0017AFFFDE|nr:hypothetical protein [Methylibium sp.]MBA3588311.1 hypothetical protein [Methylibium sp.]